MDSGSIDSKDSCDSARLTLLRQQVELAEQETRRESARAKRVEVTLQAEQRARVDAEVRCEQVIIINRLLLITLIELSTLIRIIDTQRDTLILLSPT